MLTPYSIAQATPQKLSYQCGFHKSGVWTDFPRAGISDAALVANAKLYGVRYVAIGYQEWLQDALQLNEYAN